MLAFSTYNQFDAKFKESKVFAKNRSACPIFSLLTVHNFMKNGDISKEQHEKNLNDAVSNYQKKSLPKYMSFDELMQFFDGTYSDKNVIGTTPELINQFGYDSFLKPSDYKENYCTLVLKNSNFLTILVKNTPDTPVTKLYCIRDCHEKEQYNFNSQDDLKKHLREKYQFEELTVVDGVLIEEFGNIESLMMDKQFHIKGIDKETSHDQIVLSSDEILAMQLMMDDFK